MHGEAAAVAVPKRYMPIKPHPILPKIEDDIIICSGGFTEHCPWQLVETPMGQMRGERSCARDHDACHVQERVQGDPEAR
jgi:hypothetical protein